MTLVRRRAGPDPGPVGPRVAAALAAADLALPAGAKVAVAVGSRGLGSLVELVGAVVDHVRAAGATPVIVSAMGSHGGATAEGQAEVLAGYGIDATSMGCEIRAAVEVVELRADGVGVGVATDAAAAACAATILVNRVKPHTDFRGLNESGLAKMASIGLGNRVQAERIHDHGAAGLSELVPAVARRVVAEGNVIGGVAVVDDELGRTAHVEVLHAADLVDGDARLLERARRAMPSLPVADLDLLVIDQMGKDISGVGMDTNVIGRMRAHGVAEPDTPTVATISCHALTPPSHGNACGVGLADVITRALADAVDHEVTRLNVETSGVLSRGSLPVVADDDRHAVELCLRSAGARDPRVARVARIRDTAHLSEAWVAEGALDDLAQGWEATDLRSALLDGRRLTPWP